MAMSFEQFVEQVLRSGLMSQQEMHDYLATFPEEKRPRDVDCLARNLAQDERLSAFQIEMIRKGRAEELVIGDYVMMQSLGQGGMGQVIKAVHRRTGRVVAIKLLRPETIDSADAIKRFHQEAEVAIRLRHPNIVGTYETGQQRNSHYLVMEYVEGRDLAELSQRAGPMPMRQVVDYVIQAARGLEYAHNNKVIHRDIKPANLLVDSRGNVKILDMGLARLTEGDDAAAGATMAERITRRGQMLGTVDYVSPEQAADTRSADHRSDIYSLGCTMYRLLTGKPVFEGETAIAKLIAHCESKPPSLRETLPEASEALDCVVQKMLAKQPRDRYPSMAEVIAALEACRSSLPASVAYPALSGGRPAAPVSPARPAGKGIVFTFSGQTVKSPGLEKMPLDRTVALESPEGVRQRPTGTERTIVARDLTTALPDTASSGPAEEGTRGERPEQPPHP